MKAAAATGSGRGEADDEAEDSLKAMIEKSKKVLAIQKDLLQQVPFFSLTSFLWNFCSEKLVYILLFLLKSFVY